MGEVKNQGCGLTRMKGVRAPTGRRHRDEGGSGPYQTIASYLESLQDRPGFCIKNYMIAHGLN